METPILPRDEGDCKGTILWGSREQGVRLNLLPEAKGIAPNAVQEMPPARSGKECGVQKTELCRVIASSIKGVVVKRDILREILKMPREVKQFKIALLADFEMIPDNQGITLRLTDECCKMGPHSSV